MSKVIKHIKSRSHVALRSESVCVSRTFPAIPLPLLLSYYLPNPTKGLNMGSILDVLDHEGGVHGRHPHLPPQVPFPLYLLDLALLAYDPFVTSDCWGYRGLESYGR